MTSLALHWFSGTGNTWLAAEALAQALNARGVEVVLRRIETATPPELAPGQTLGLAFPVACFSTYPVVTRFVEALPPGEGRDVVALATMGGASGGMAGPLGRRLRARGYRTVAVRCFVMPGNYGNRTVPVEANARLIATMRRDMDAYADALLAGTARWPRGYPLWSEGWRRLAAGPHPWALFKRVFPLAVDRDRCSQCGLCARLCPANAIELVAGRPVWGRACMACQRCVGYCPEHAIHVPGKPAEPYHAAPLEVLLGNSTSPQREQSERSVSP